MKEVDLMEITISFFKKSGKWYTDETLIVPAKFNNEILDMRFYNVRVWVEENICENCMHNEFIAVCTNEDVIGYPMLVHPLR